jgi:hypothetical protein
LIFLPFAVLFYLISDHTGGTRKIKSERERERERALVLLGRWRENEREMGAIKGAIVDGILTCMWVFSVLCWVFSPPS